MSTPDSTTPPAEQPVAHLDPPAGAIATAEVPSTPPADEVVTGELVNQGDTTEVPTALLQTLLQKVDALEAAQPPKVELPKVDAVLDGIYEDDGRGGQVAKASAVPLDCPILSCGSSDPSVADKLVPVLNYALGVQLVQGDPHVTPEVLSAARQFVARYGVPEDPGVSMDPKERSNYIGPNVWAAIAAVNRDRATAAAA